MTKDDEEFNKLIGEKNITDVDTMLEESKNLVKKIPNLGEKIEKVIMLRGIVIDSSIRIETAFDELIIRTGGKDLFINPEKKQLHLITGAKKENELGGLTFNNKTTIIKSIIKKMYDEFTYTNYLQSKDWEKKNNYFINYFKKCRKCGSTEQLGSRHISYKNFGKEQISDVEVLCWYCQIGREPKPLELPNSPEPPLLANLDRFVAIRNLFAHLPISLFSKEPEFDDNPRYEKRYFRLDKKWKNVSVAFNEFINLQEEILGLTKFYIKQVLLKRERYSQILLGKSFNDILKEAQKSQQDKTKP